MRLLGALLLSIASCLLGVMKARELRNRTECLSELISFLDSMKYGLQSSALPIKEIIERAGEYKHIASFLAELSCGMNKLNDTGFNELWRGTVRSRLCGLSDRQSYLLCSLGESIGRFDASIQSEAIEHCRQELSKDLSEMNSMLSADQKLYIGLGGGAGLILSIILI